MANRKPSIKEVEELGYYDFMTYLGAPFFHFGGPKASFELVEMCRITKESHLLIVGCGAGYTACLIAEKIGCRVTGIDLAEGSIEKANERAGDMNLSEKTEFMVADVYSLPFEDETFDAVITEFVAQFLDSEKAFPEIKRVLKKGGHFGIDELFRDSAASPEADRKIDKAVDIFTDVTGLPFKIYRAEDWDERLNKAGFTDVNYEKFLNIKNVKEIVKRMGGWLKLFSMIIPITFKMLYYYAVSSKIRHLLNLTGRGKNLLTRDGESSKYVGYVLMTGRKQ